MGVEDPYEAFCFDEACSYIHNMIVYEEQEPSFMKKNYKSFSELYKAYREG